MAFAILVERHGPMVLRTCRGILRDDHEAMDAFQATFLVLVRRPRRCGSATRWGPGSIGSPAGSRGGPEAMLVGGAASSAGLATAAPGRAGGGDREDVAAARRVGS